MRMGPALIWQVAEESRDPFQPSVGAQGAHIDAGDGHAAVRPYHLPGEAELVVVGIDAADPLQGVAREVRASGIHHFT